MPYIYREKEIKNFKHLYKIAEVAEIAICQTSALRFYEDEGVLPRMRKDKEGNRVYTRANMRTAVTLVLLRRYGVDVTACKEAIEGKYAEELLKCIRVLRKKAGQKVQ